MVARGRVQNGVIVLENGVRLPEGTAVTVLPDSELARRDVDAVNDRMSDEERHALVAAFARIAVLPTEGSTEPFSARDHDRVL